MQRTGKHPRALSLATPSSMLSLPGLDDDPFHWDTVREQLNVSEVYFLFCLLMNGW